MLHNACRGAPPPCLNSREVATAPAVARTTAAMADTSEAGEAHTEALAAMNGPAIGPETTGPRDPSRDAAESGNRCAGATPPAARPFGINEASPQPGEEGRAASPDSNGCGQTDALPAEPANSKTDVPTSSDGSCGDAGSPAPPTTQSHVGAAAETPASHQGDNSLPGSHSESACKQPADGFSPTDPILAAAGTVAAAVAAAGLPPSGESVPPLPLSPTRPQRAAVAVWSTDRIVDITGKGGQRLSVDVSSRFPVISSPALAAIRAAEEAELAAARAAEEADQNALCTADGSPHKAAAPVRRRKSVVSGSRKRRRPSAQRQKAEEASAASAPLSAQSCGPPPTPFVQEVESYPRRKFPRPPAGYACFVDKRQQSMEDQVRIGCPKTIRGSLHPVFCIILNPPPFPPFHPPPRHHQVLC